MKAVHITYLVVVLVPVSVMLALAAEQAAPASGESAEAQAAQVAAEQKAQEQALATQKDQAIQYIAKGEIAQADAAVGQLLSRFSSQEGLPQALYDIGRKYGEVGNNAKAEPLYRQVVQQWHETEWAANSQREIIRECIKKQDAAATQAALDTLLTDFAKHEHIARTIYNLGKYYNSLNDSEMAAKLHRYNVEHYPADHFAMWSQVEIIKSDIRNGDDAAVDAACNKLLSVFSSEKTLPKEVFQLGALYNKEQKQDKARVFYQYVLDHWSESEYAIHSALAILDGQPEGGNASAAKATFDKLLAAFAQQKTPAKEIYKLARDYSASHKDRALKLHQFNSRNSAKEDQYTMWSQTELAKVYIRDGNEPLATAAIKDLTSRFSDQAGLPTQLLFVGDTYAQAKKYDRADQLYAYVCDHWPGNEQLLGAKVGQARVCIAKGNDKAAEAIFSKIVADYATHPELSEALLTLGAGYYSRGAEQWARDSTPESPDTPRVPQPPSAVVKQSHAKAIEKWSLLLQRYPRVPEVSPMALYCSAISHSQMNETTKAVECYQKFLDEWPDQEQNHHILLRLPGLYSELVAKEVLTEEQANALTKGAYETFVQKYPTSPAAEMAGRQARYYEMVLEGTTHEE